MKIHKESMLNVPLVNEMMSDSSVTFIPRAIDSNWLYDSVTPLQLRGFNPAAGAIYYSSTSRLAKFLKAPQASIRSINSDDLAAQEVMFATHDYLHVWAYQAIKHLQPDLGFGVKPVTEKNFEDFVFCHLLTEAVATVGLDYWYCLEVDFDSVVPVASRAAPVTVAMAREDFKEFKRVGFDLETIMNQVDFFTTIADLYMTGEFHEVDPHAVEKSPRVKRWLMHELQYGSQQRSLSRDWLNYLSGGVCQQAALSNDEPVQHDKRWQKKLTRDLAEMLWSKVVLEEKIRFRPLKTSRAWTAPAIADGLTDFRFFNINSWGNEFWPKILNSKILPESEQSFFWQIVSKYPLEKVDAERIMLLTRLNPIKDVGLMHYLLKDLKPLRVQSESPALFLPN